MADTITFISKDGEAERILDAFEERTGLAGDETPEGRSYDIDGTEHEIKIVETLNEIDEEWPHHLALESPA